MVYYYGSFLAHIVIIILSSRLLLKPCVYSFIIHHMGGKLLRHDFSQAVLHLVLRGQASSSHFPFSCFTSWDVLMNQVLLGNRHTPGCTAQSCHSRRSINICGMDNESWITTINRLKQLAFSLLLRQWSSNFSAHSQVFSKARVCAGQ